MKKILLIIAMFVTTVSFGQTTWEKTSLTDKISISFPGKPSSSNSSGRKSFILKHPDSTANFIVAVTDLQVAAGIDAATLEMEMEKEEFWEQTRDAFVNSMGAEAKLVKDEIITVKNTEALRLFLERKTATGATNLITALIFVNGTNSLNIIFNSRGGKADKKVEQQFFDSIVIL